MLLAGGAICSYNYLELVKVRVIITSVAHKQQRTWLKGDQE
jgi:hypothetical protein